MQCREPNRWAAAIEAAAMGALLLSYIWVWQGAFPGAFLVCLALYLGLGAASHARRGEGARELGFRLDNLGAAARNAAPVLLAFVAAGLLAGGLLGSWHFPDPALAALKLLRGFLWGTLQQYGLLCVFYRRLLELTGRDAWAIPLSGAIFAAFHWPNPFLVAVTLVAGMVACRLYDREPNVPVLGAVHAAVSFVNQHALPLAVTLGQRVGP